MERLNHRPSLHTHSTIFSSDRIKKLQLGPGCFKESLNKPQSIVKDCESTSHTLKVHILDG